MWPRPILLCVLVAACGRIDFDAASSPAPGVDGAADGNASSGLVGWWKFDEGAGAQAADSSGQGNTGTLSAGIAWAAGHLGDAIDTDGGTDHDVDLGDPAVLQLTGSMTVTAWVRASSFHLGTPTDDVVASRCGQETGWALKGTEDCGPEQIAMQIGLAPQSIVERCSTTALSVNVWYHVAGVYDDAAQTIDVYVDGVLDDGMLIGTIPAAQFEPSVHSQVGDADAPSNSSGGPHTFTGLIDDVRVYDRALTSPEIAALAAM